MSDSVHPRPSQATFTGSLPRVGVVIATLGRPHVVAETIRRIIEGQVDTPDIIIISCISLEDAGAAARFAGVKVVTGPAGLAAQRNTALGVIPDFIDIVVFFDDDFVPEAEWLREVARIFNKNPDIVCLTGNVLLDGIKGPGLSFEEVDCLLRKELPVRSTQIVEPFSPYGCNMALRRSAIGDLRFDERLVLYGWLEDRDFGAAMAQRGGQIVKYMGARGIHMGVKNGRIEGERLGYSQVINPLYLMRKGTMGPTEAVGQIFRNMASNLLRVAIPEPFIDRRGRLYGNFRAIFDLLQGQLKPELAIRIKRPVK